MEIIFSLKALKQFEYWKTSGNKKVFNKIRTLLDEVRHTPFEDSGKPEQLKYEFAGYWSRRITDEHRLVYKVENDVVLIIQLRYHY